MCELNGNSQSLTKSFFFPHFFEFRAVCDFYLSTNILFLSSLHRLTLAAAIGNRRGVCDPRDQ